MSYNLLKLLIGSGYLKVVDVRVFLLFLYYLPHGEGRCPSFEYD